MSRFFLIPVLVFFAFISSCSVDEFVLDLNGGGARENLPPSVPLIVVDNKTTTSIKISWSASDPENQPLKYNVFIGSTQVLSNTSTTTYTFTDLTPLTDYTITVVAIDDKGLTTTSVATVQTASESCVPVLSTSFVSNNISAFGNIVFQIVVTSNSSCIKRVESNGLVFTSYTYNLSGISINLTQAQYDILAAGSSSFTVFYVENGIEKSITSTYTLVEDSGTD